MLTRHIKPPLVIALTLGLAQAALAGPETYVKDTEVKADDKKPEGWDLTATVGATVNFNDNRNVVGQPEGSSLTLGTTANGIAAYLRDKRDWRNTVAIKEAFTRTPVIDDFVKSADELKLESVFVYRVKPQLGAFARLALDTSLFEGKNVQPGPVTYNIMEPDEVTVRESRVSDEIHLTDALLPFRLKESLGIASTPVRKESILTEIRLGVGARSTFADDQLAVKDNAATPEIEIVDLRSVHQGGVEATVTASGTLSRKRVTYKATAEVMMPILHGDLPAGDDRGIIDLTNVELTAGLSFKLVSWASLDYQFKTLREPQLLDEWQVQNNLLLTFAYTLLQRKPPQPPPPPPPPCVPVEPAPAASPASVPASQPAVPATEAPAGTP